jgi:hypothetical protein
MSIALRDDAIEIDPAPGKPILRDFQIVGAR